MNFSRIYVFGASGSGTTTLGAKLAHALDLTHIDADDHYWIPSDPPFSKKRPIAARLRSMKAAMKSDGWIISGSCHGWANEFVKEAELLVFVSAPTEVRLKRLMTREADRFGARILSGGDMFDIHKAFLAWAAEYDNPIFEGRSRTGHEKWLAQQARSICRLDGCQKSDDLVQRILAHMA